MSNGGRRVQCHCVSPIMMMWRVEAGPWGQFWGKMHSCTSISITVQYARDHVETWDLRGTSPFYKIPVSTGLVTVVQRGISRTRGNPSRLRTHLPAVLPRWRLNEGSMKNRRATVSCYEAFKAFNSLTTHGIEFFCCLWDFDFISFRDHSPNTVTYLLPCLLLTEMSLAIRKDEVVLNKGFQDQKSPENRRNRIPDLFCVDYVVTIDNIERHKVKGSSFALQWWVPLLYG